MSLVCVTGAQMLCTFGAAPSSLVATSNPTTNIEGQAVATLTDAAPVSNIPPFGMCSSMANPQVAAATAAALGVLTPQPCVPVTKSWIPEETTVMFGGEPVVTQDCKCNCAYGGVIAISTPGQTVVST